MHNYAYSVTLKIGGPRNGTVNGMRSLAEAKAAVRRMFGSDLVSMEVWEI